MAKARKSLHIRLGEDVYKQLVEIMDAKRWGPQTLGEVMVEHYLKLYQAAKQQAAQQAAKSASGSGSGSGK